LKSRASSERSRTLAEFTAEFFSCGVPTEFRGSDTTA
jgi:hypothetical protein